MDKVLARKIVALWTLYDDIQKVRIGMGLRAGRRLEDLQKNPLFGGDSDLLFVAGETAGIEIALKKIEGKVKRKIEKRANELDWYHEVAVPCMMEGGGTTIAAGLLAITIDLETGRDIDRFSKVSSLWKYCGLHVGEDGRAVRRERGKKLESNPRAGFILQRLADMWNYNPNGYWRVKVDAWQVREEEKHGPERCCEPCEGKACRHHCPGPILHPRLRAFRKAKKEFLKLLWVRWRQWKGLEAYEESELLDQNIVQEKLEVIT